MSATRGSVNFLGHFLRRAVGRPAVHPPIAPKLDEFPWAPADPIRQMAFDAERPPQRRNGVRAPALNVGQLVLRRHRFIIAWQNFGGLGAKLSNLVRNTKLRIIRNTETASRPEKMQNAAWSHLARKRGNMRTIRDELVKLNNDRLLQGSQGQQSEFCGRTQGSPSGFNRRRPPHHRRLRPNQRSSKRRKPRFDISREGREPQRQGHHGKRA